MVHALNAQTAQYATNVEKDAESAQRARTNWWIVHDAPTDRQIVFVYLLSREILDEKVRTHWAYDIEYLKIYAKATKHANL